MRLLTLIGMPVVVLEYQVLPWLKIRNFRMKNPRKFLDSVGGNLTYFLRMGPISNITTH